MRRLILPLSLIFSAALLSAAAPLPEIDNVVYGAFTRNGQPLQGRLDGNTLQVRTVALDNKPGELLGEYTIGERAQDRGVFFVLRAKLNNDYFSTIGEISAGEYFGVFIADTLVSPIYVATAGDGTSAMTPLTIDVAEFGHLLKAKADNNWAMYE